MVYGFSSHAPLDNSCSLKILLHKPSWFVVVRGWSGSTMVLSKLSVTARPTSLDDNSQGPTVLAVGAGGGYLDIFSFVYLYSLLSPFFWETGIYRLKYCLKGPLYSNQPTNHCRYNCSRYCILKTALTQVNVRMSCC